MTSQDISLESLLEAYIECRKNKRYTLNALAFEVNYEENLMILLDEMNSGLYEPGRSIAFMIHKPVKREIFAADFRGRVVHHLLINKLNPLFERMFINDSYACRKGRGTHFGIQRIDRFIRQCSHNYTQDCYVLRLDIQGFFMAIDKQILWAKLCELITKQYQNPDKYKILSLCQKILSNNPPKNCFVKGSRRNWHDFPPNKSLFHSAPGCGLPIGNLTSQVFANVYLNDLDHFVKHDLGIRFSKGVHFLGMMIKPHQIQCGKRTKGNFYEAIEEQNKVIENHSPNREERRKFLCSMNSYLGILSHYNTYHLRQVFLKQYLNPKWRAWFRTQKDFKKVIKIK